MRLNTLVFLLLGGIWGSTWMFIKIGLADVPPFTFVAVRFMIAAAALLGIIALRRIPLPRRWRDWRVILFTGGLAISGCYGLVYWAELYIPSGLASVLSTTIPLFGLLFGHVLLADDRITARKLVGVLLGLGGVTLIFSGQLSASGAMAAWGTLAMLGAAISAALANVIIKRTITHVSPVVLSGGQMLFGMIPLTIISTLAEGNPFAIAWTAKAIWALLYLAIVGTVIAFVLFYWLVQRIPVSRAQLIPFLSTILAVLLGAIVLGERLNWQTGLGSVVVLTGLAVALLTRRRRRSTRIHVV